jgi:hypothetical protein
MRPRDVTDELVELCLELADDSAGRIVAAEPYEGGAALPVPGPRFGIPRESNGAMYLPTSAIEALARLGRPHVRDLPRPRPVRHRPQGT